MFSFAPCTGVWASNVSRLPAFSFLTLLFAVCLLCIRRAFYLSINTKIKIEMTS
jgi:hypothetical protein